MKAISARPLQVATARKTQTGVPAAVENDEPRDTLAPGTLFGVGDDNRGRLYLPFGSGSFKSEDPTTYVGVSRGNIVRLNAEGELLFSIPGRNNLTVHRASGTLLTKGDGRIEAYDLADGKPRGRFEADWSADIHAGASKILLEYQERLLELSSELERIRELPLRGGLFSVDQFGDERLAVRDREGLRLLDKDFKVLAEFSDGDRPVLSGDGKYFHFLQKSKNGETSWCRVEVQSGESQKIELHETPRRIHPLPDGGVLTQADSRFVGLGKDQRRATAFRVLDAHGATLQTFDVMGGVEEVQLSADGTSMYASYQKEERTSEGVRWTYNRHHDFILERFPIRQRGRLPAKATRGLGNLANLVGLEEKNRQIRTSPKPEMFAPLENGELLVATPNELLRYDEQGQALASYPSIDAFEADGDRAMVRHPHKPELDSLESRLTELFQGFPDYSALWGERGRQTSNGLEIQRGEALLASPVEAQAQRREAFWDLDRKYVSALGSVELETQAVQAQDVSLVHRLKLVDRSGHETVGEFWSDEEPSALSTFMCGSRLMLAVAEVGLGDDDTPALFIYEHGESSSRRRASFSTRRCAT